MDMQSARIAGFHGNSISFLLFEKLNDI